MQLEATLLTIAWLLPLLGFSIEIWGGFLWHRLSKTAAYMAVFCIAAGFVLSLTALLHWGNRTDWAADAGHHDATEVAAGGEEQPDTHKPDAHKEDAGHEKQEAEHGTHEPYRFTGTYYEVASFGRLSISLGYYIDSLTLVMFVMVTLIATCIHVFALGYMSDELTEDYVDHQVHVGGGHLHRPGRFYRFFAFMSLFCFAMLGLVISGNAFMTFVFWELVGICSYFLIGFYTERHSASTAANKAFIVNRIGDFGFLIGLMIFWTWCGTLQYSNPEYGQPGHEDVKPGLFEMVRGEHGELSVQREDGKTVVALHGVEEGSQSIPYFLLVAAGLGVFAGCVGKSAQFPLQTWLPDAMEGPTPVSALVHSATMVAAGVFLVGRFYPMFTPEVLLTIAYIGGITLFVAATIAVVATDIKRVLAYSTISQLGYMMLALGVGGWGAGLFHLITHAFFKSLMFLCSGSVIVGCHHEQEMTKMGGLWRKMPFTAFTMLVGVIAISGLAIPGLIAFSGYHSKDAIIATALTYAKLNPAHGLLVILPLVGAGITAFYMFRLWFYTFTGKPRDQHVYDHAKESPWIMVGPLVVLSVFAAFCAAGGEHGALYGLLSPSEPVGLADGTVAVSESAAELSHITLPSHEQIGDNHAEAGMFALAVAGLGTLIAFLFYGVRVLDPGEVKRQLSGIHTFLVEKWWFDELYEVMFIRPVHVIAGWISAFDRVVIDGILHRTTAAAIDVSKWDRRFDEQIVDGLVNWVGTAVFSVGRSLSVVQTGRLRQYIMFIAGGIFALLLIAFVLAI